MSFLRYDLVLIRTALTTCQDSLLHITSWNCRKKFFLNGREDGDSQPFRNVGKKTAINTV
jgi:hypothetical protein